MHAGEQESTLLLSETDPAVDLNYTDLDHAFFRTRLRSVPAGLLDQFARAPQELVTAPG